MASMKTFMPLTLDTLPNELIVIIAKALNPADLYSFILTKKRFRDLIMSSISIFTRMYAKTMKWDIERFMWSLFEYRYINIRNTNQLFLKMLGVHMFTNTNQLEYLWEQYDMFNSDGYSTLPEDVIELYLTKFQAGMIYATCPSFSLEVAALFSHQTEGNTFKFLFKFINKYHDIGLEYSKEIVADIEELCEKDITFEMVDEYIQQASLYGAEERDTYEIIINDQIDAFLRLLTHGVDPDKAVFDVDSDEYSDNELEIYNSVRHIIGNHFAHIYILYNKVNINGIPNFLENVVKLHAIGIEDICIVDAFLRNPTYERFENIRFQHDIIGTVDITLL